MTLVYDKALGDYTPNEIISYHGYDGERYITDMTGYEVTTDKDKEGTQLIGQEWELSRDSRITTSLLEKIKERFNFVQFSSDSTIPGSYGMEIQTPPMSKNALIEAGMEDLFKFLRDNGFKASAVTNLDNGDGCGGHIHISRGENWEDIVTLMIMFIDQNKEIVQIICKRPFTRFAKNNLERLYKSTQRYSMTGVKEFTLQNTEEHAFTINLQHPNTIEFRLPVGTLNFETKMAHIEFITNLYKCCEDVVNGKARLDRLTINKVCQDGDYLPGYIKKLCISCSRQLIVLDREIKTRVKELESDKAKLIKVLSDLQYELARTNDDRIRQGSINTINNDLMNIINATSLENLLRNIKYLKEANTISDGLETYSQQNDNKIAKYYKQLKDVVANINVENVYHDILEEV